MSGSEALLYAYLAGSGLQMVGGEQQKREQKRILNQSMAESDATQGKAVEAVAAEGAQLAPESRLKAMQTAEQGAYNRTMADVGGGGVMVDTSQGAGAVSDDFTRARAERGAAENSRLSEVVRGLSKMRAPGDVATDGAMRRSAISEQLGSLWSSQRGRSQAAKMDAESVDMPGYGQMGGLVAMASGAAMAAGAGGAAATGGGEAAGTMLGEGVASGVPEWDAAYRAVPPSQTSYMATPAQSAARKQQVTPWWAGR